MITYIWKTTDNRVVYLNGVVEATETQANLEAARAYAATMVNNEPAFSTAFNTNVKPYLASNATYTDYFTMDDACMYGICSVCTTLHLDDNGTRVESSLVGDKSKVLYLDFYNIVGRDGLDGTSGSFSYGHVVYGNLVDGAYVIAEGGEYLGIAYNQYAENSPEWQAISANTNQYMWTRIKGDKGSNAEIRWADLTDEEKEALKNELRGADGTDGNDGAAGNAAFKSIVFKRSSTKPDSLGSAGDYKHPVPSGWYDGIPDVDENNIQTQVWMSSRIFSSDGKYPQESTWSEPSQVSDSEYMDYEFSTSNDKPSAPEKEFPFSESSPGWSNEATSESIWMAMCKVKNGLYETDQNGKAKWTITRIKGENGSAGISIKALGTLNSLEELLAITDAVAGDSYVVDGYLYTYNPSINDDELGHWVKVGKFTGNNSYLHVKYAQTVTTGGVFVNYLNKFLKFTGDDEDGEEPGAYMGIYSDNEYTDSSEISAYTWTKTEGKDGFGMEFIFMATSDEEAPAVPTSENTPSVEGHDWSDEQNYDFVPNGWFDDVVSTSLLKPYVWVCTRVCVDGVWQGFTGDKDNPDVAALYSHYAKDGESGLTPEAQFTSIIFKKSNALLSEANMTNEQARLATYSSTIEAGGSYVNPLTSTMVADGWNDSIPAGNEITWMSTRVFYTNDEKTLATGWSKPVCVNDSEEMDYEWTDFPTSFGVKPDAPNKIDPSDATRYNVQVNGIDKDYYWYDEPIDDATYMAVRSCKGGSYLGGSWKVSRIKGEDGDNGTSIKPKKSYATLQDFIDDWTTSFVNNGITYQPAYTGTVAEENVELVNGRWKAPIENGYDESDTMIVEGYMFCWDGSDEWVNIGQFRGEKGESQYLHIKYANDTTLRTPSYSVGEFTIDNAQVWLEFTDGNGEKPGKYIATLVNSVEDDPSHIQDYTTWKRWEGNDGFGYEYIFALCNSEVAPFVPKYSATVTEIGTYSAGTVNGTLVTDRNIDDFVPIVTEITWYDSPQTVTSASPYCWMAYRMKKDNAWTDFYGTSRGDGQINASLWSKYGFDGQDGKSGLTPVAQFTSIIFVRGHEDWATSSETLDADYNVLSASCYTEEGGTYVSPVPTIQGWSDGIPSGNGLLWMSTRVFSTDEEEHTCWSRPVMAVDDNSSIDYEWTNYPVSAGTPTVKPSKSSPKSSNETIITGDYKWYDDAISGATFMAIRKIKNGAYDGDWQISRIVGEDGDNGSSVSISTLTFQTLNEFAEYVNGTVNGNNVVVTERPADTGISYIVNGYLYAYNGSSEYVPVSKFVGEKGDSGSCMYIHVRYANKTTDTVNHTTVDDVLTNEGTLRLKFSTNGGATPAEYQGTMVDDIEDATLIMSAYTWVKCTGRDGFGFEYIYKPTSGETAPRSPASITESANGKAKTDDDFVPLGWFDDPVSVSLEHRCVWVSVRRYKDGSWGDFGPVSLYARYAADGETGISGISLSSITDYYMATNSSSTKPSKNPLSAWTVGTYPAIYSPVYRFLWNFERTIFTDGSSAETEVNLISSIGKGISSITEWYALSDTYENGLTTTNLVSATTTNAPQMTDDYPYLWNQEQVNYDDNTYTQSEWVCIGYKGKNGSNGTSVQIKGTYNTIGEFYSSSTVNMTGTILYNGTKPYEISGSTNSGAYSDAYMIDGYLWVWDGDSWNNVGQIKGDKGDPGTPGAPGVSYFIYTKYAYRSTDGGTIITVSGEPSKITVKEATETSDIREYFGVLTTTSDTMPSDLTLYTWSKFRGDDGFGYEYIYALTANENTKPHTPRYKPSPTSPGEYSGGTNASIDRTMDDFVPKVTGENITWYDDAPSITSADTCCWRCMRKKTNRVWGDFSGNTNGYAILHSKYGVDGAPGAAGQDGTDVEYIFFRSKYNMTITQGEASASYNGIIGEILGL